VVLAEGLLHRVHPVPVGETLDGGDISSVRLGGQHGAGLDRLAADEHRARPTRGGIAADVGPREPYDVTQIVDEEQARLYVVLVLLAVDPDRYLHAFPLCRVNVASHRHYAKSAGRRAATWSWVAERSW
jgi:hypothetical protein